MTLVGEDHRAHDAVFRETPGGTVVEHYGRPERTHRAVRNGMGVIEMGYGIIEVTGSDRQEYVDNIVSNRVPAADGQGVYAVLLRPEGKIRADLYIYATGERLLLFTAADVAGEIAAEWAERTFIQDVEIREATTAFGVFGVHGPLATEKVASVLSTQTPAGTLAFDRGRMGDVGVTVIRSDDPTGQEGYEVVCAAADAPAVYDTLLYGGPSAVPVGYRTWETLTLEAGTPLFETELAGQVPNVGGWRTEASHPDSSSASRYPTRPSPLPPGRRSRLRRTWARSHARRSPRHWSTPSRWRTSTTGSAHSRSPSRGVPVRSWACHSSRRPTPRHADRPFSSDPRRSQGSSARSCAGENSVDGRSMWTAISPENARRPTRWSGAGNE